MSVRAWDVGHAGKSCFAPIRGIPSSTAETDVFEEGLVLPGMEVNQFCLDDLTLVLSPAEVLGRILHPSIRGQGGYLAKPDTVPAKNQPVQ